MYARNRILLNRIKSTDLLNYRCSVGCNVETMPLTFSSKISALLEQGRKKRLSVLHINVHSEKVCARHILLDYRTTEPKE